MELLERVAQVFVILVVDGEDSRVHHGLGLAIARERLGRGAKRAREGIAHAHRLRIFKARHHETDLTHGELVYKRLGRALHTYAVNEERMPRLHHLKLVALLDASIEDAHRSNDATVLIEVRIQDERFERSRRITLRGRDQKDDRFEQVMDALARLAGNAHRIVGGDGKLILDLELDLIRMRRR